MKIPVFSRSDSGCIECIHCNLSSLLISGCQLKNMSSHVSLDVRLDELTRHKYMSREKVLCSICREEGRRSRVILYPGKTIPEMKFTTGYWDEKGDFVEPKVEFEPPWYLCSNGHITQVIEGKYVTS